jgi:deoxyribodipyrimidine photo-lyase
MIPNFNITYNEIIARIDEIDPVKYCKTRNYIDGDITYLSPFVSRGIISTRLILERVMRKGYSIIQIEQFVKELVWRDYFQRVWQHKNMNQAIMQEQQGVLHHQLPAALQNANTSIVAVDDAIEQLYATGYMHNHNRMYTASIACNIGQAHWLQPAQWMYYHLIDGDWASNACSWQWVCAANSKKKYYANQENISRFCKSNQVKSFLNIAYEQLETMPIPNRLEDTIDFKATTPLPDGQEIKLDANMATCIYNYYNVDPNWYAAEKVNRVLLLEPSVFAQYPISQNCIDFLLHWATQIDGMQIFVGSFDELLTTHQLKNIYFKEHPLNKHYKGFEESRDWIDPATTSYYPSFFGFWNSAEKQLKKQYP